MPSSTSTSNLHAADAPLPAGTLLENLGLGLVIVCTKVSCDCLYGSTTLVTNRECPDRQADQMNMLERDREFSEDLFDHVQQLVRTVALRCELSCSFFSDLLSPTSELMPGLHEDGAAVFYTSQTNPASYAKLRQYILHRLFAPDPSLQLATTTPTPTSTAATSRTAPAQSTPRQSARASFPFLHRANVVDRDQVLVPAGWDTWGKIKILRERFDCDACGQRWEADLEAKRRARDLEGEPGRVREPASADGLEAEYASAVVDFDARNQVRNIKGQPGRNLLVLTLSPHAVHGFLVQLDASRK
jgi:dynein light intermediate chain 1